MTVARSVIVRPEPAVDATRPRDEESATLMRASSLISDALVISLPVVQSSSLTSPNASCPSRRRPSGLSCRLDAMTPVAAKVLTSLWLPASQILTSLASLEKI